MTAGRGGRTSEGRKADGGKPPVASQVLAAFPDALREVAAAGAHGAARYGADDNWRGVPDGRRRYADALARHLLDHLQGLATDPSSGLRPAASVAWNALAVLQLAIEAEQAAASGEVPDDRILRAFEDR